MAYFEALARGIADARRASNWIQQDVLRWLKEHRASMDQYPVPVEEMAALLRRVADGQLDTTRARQVLAHMTQSGQTVTEAIQHLGIRTIDPGEIETLCLQLLQDHPAIANAVRAGKMKALGALIGQARKRNPSADPRMIRQTLQRLLTHPSGDASEE